MAPLTIYLQVFRCKLMKQFQGYETELRDMSTDEVMQLLKFANLIDFDIERVTEGYLATRSIK